MQICLLFISYSPVNNKGTPTSPSVTKINPTVPSSRHLLLCVKDRQCRQTAGPVLGPHVLILSVVPPCAGLLTVRQVRYWYLPPTVVGRRTWGNPHKVHSKHAINAAAQGPVGRDPGREGLSWWSCWGAGKVPPSEWLRLNLKRGTGKRLPERGVEGWSGRGLARKNYTGEAAPRFQASRNIGSVV